MNAHGDPEPERARYALHVPERIMTSPDDPLRIVEEFVGELERQPIGLERMKVYANDGGAPLKCTLAMRQLLKDARRYRFMKAQMLIPENLEAGLYEVRRAAMGARVSAT